MGAHGFAPAKRVLKVFVAVTAKAGLLATLTADINVDLNDLPDTLPTSQWSDPMTPTRPADSNDWTYDGHIRMDEIRETIDYDPSMLVNVNGEISVGARAIAEVSIGSMNLIAFSEQLAQVALIDFDIVQADDEAIIEKNNDGVVLGRIDSATGQVTVFAGASAADREGILHSVKSDARDENFRIRKVGASEIEGRESVQVTYWFIDESSARRAYSQTFTDVSSVVIDSGDGDDELVAEPSLRVAAILDAGSGTDLVMGAAATTRSTAAESWDCAISLATTCMVAAGMTRSTPSDTGFLAKSRKKPWSAANGFVENRGRFLPHLAE